MVESPPQMLMLQITALTGYYSQIQSHGLHNSVAILPQSGLGFGWANFI